jgi:hypothetical protein
LGQAIGQGALPLLSSLTIYGCVVDTEFNALVDGLKLGGRLTSLDAIGL